MTTLPCPACGSETFEIRAKLVCRGCGTILETCCEGGPMGHAESCPPSPSVRPAPPDDSRPG